MTTWKYVRYGIVIVVVLLGVGWYSTANVAARADVATTTAPAAHLQEQGGVTRYCSETPIDIPDNLPDGAFGTIEVGTSGIIDDLNVIVTSTHTWVGDLTLSISDGTTSVTFFDRPGHPATAFGCSGDHLPGVVADDEGVHGTFEHSCMNTTPAFEPGGTYSDTASLSVFDGQETAATWRLTASDSAEGDTGVIDSWCIEFIDEPGPTLTPTPTSTRVPDIQVTPGALEEVHTDPPQVTTDTFAIQNMGTETLTWTIAEDAGRPAKLMVSKSGEYRYAGPVTLPSGALTFSTSGISTGTTSHLPDLSQGKVFLTHSATQNISALNSISCNANGLHADNSYLRVFDLAGEFGIMQDIAIDAISFGVEDATSATGNQPVTVNLYTLSGVLNTANLTLIGSQSAAVPDSATGTIFSVPFTPEVEVFANSVLVVEVFTPNGQTAGNSFFIGSNADPETAPSYIMAADCGLTQPAATGSIGFPDMHIVLNVFARLIDGGGLCSNPIDIPWLSVSPMNGTTASGGASTVAVTYDSSTLTTGIYTGTLCVNSDDPDEPLVTIPLTLTIGAPTAIDVSQFAPVISGIPLVDVAAAGLLLATGVLLLLRRK